MQKDEIMRYLEVGSSRTITIACDSCEKYPGYVRTITIQKDYIVKIEFEVYGYDEGGITYFIQYNCFELLIYSLEKYLGKKLDEWENINKTGYYPEPINCNKQQTNEIINQDLIDDKIELPELANNIWMPDGYWKQLHDGMWKTNLE